MTYCEGNVKRKFKISYITLHSGPLFTGRADAALGLNIAGACLPIYTSNHTVKGPSFTKPTCMSAPKTPLPTWRTSFWASEQNES